MLGGFKRSSQHPEGGGCDEHSKAAIGSVWTSAFTVTGTAACGGTR
jgi:putative transposase